jgi:hypothetical protein
MKKRMALNVSSYIIAIKAHPKLVTINAESSFHRRNFARQGFEERSFTNARRTDNTEDFRRL